MKDHDSLKTTSILKHQKWTNMISTSTNINTAHQVSVCFVSGRDTSGCVDLSATATAWSHRHLSMQGLPACLLDKFGLLPKIAPHGTYAAYAYLLSVYKYTNYIISSMFWYFAHPQQASDIFVWNIFWGCMSGRQTCPPLQLKLQVSSVWLLWCYNALLALLAWRVSPQVAQERINTLSRLYRL